MTRTNLMTNKSYFMVINNMNNMYLVFIKNGNLSLEIMS